MLHRDLRGGRTLPTELFEKIDALADEELSLYKALWVLVDEEEARVDESDMEGLLEVLRQKQNIISRQEILLERWNEISSSLGLTEGREGPVFWSMLSDKIGETGSRQIASRIDEVKKLGQSLLDREGVIRGKLETNLVSMRETLLRMGRSRTALRGYSQGIASATGVY